MLDVFSLGFVAFRMPLPLAGAVSAENHHFVSFIGTSIKFRKYVVNNYNILKHKIYAHRV